MRPWSKRKPIRSAAPARGGGDGTETKFNTAASQTWNTQRKHTLNCTATAWCVSRVAIHQNSPRQSGVGSRAYAAPHEEDRRSLHLAAQLLHG